MVRPCGIRRSYARLWNDESNHFRRSEKKTGEKETSSYENKKKEGKSRWIRYIFVGRRHGQYKIWVNLQYFIANIQIYSTYLKHDLKMPSESWKQTALETMALSKVREWRNVIQGIHREPAPFLRAVGRADTLLLEAPPCPAYKIGACRIQTWCVFN